MSPQQFIAGWLAGFGTLALLLLPFSGNLCAAEYRAKYIQNWDGDTLTLEIDGKREKLRLSGVDSAEIHSKCTKEHDLALRAREFTRTWALSSYQLTLTTGKREREKFGRLLGELTNERGESLSEKLIEAGLAVRWEGHRHKGWCD